VAIVSVVPTIQDGQPDIDIQRLQLGRLRIPLLLTAGTAQRGVNLFLDDALTQVQGAVRITDMSLTQGTITIRASVDPQALLQP